LMLTYNMEGEVALQRKGNRGFDEFTPYLNEDMIAYVVAEVTIKGDEYNPIKYCLITWIGSKVNPGLAKARCAGHRVELLEFIKGKIGIAGEFQPASKSDLSSKALADKLTRVAHNDTSVGGVTKQNMSRAAVDSGDKHKSHVVLVDENNIKEALKKVHKGNHTWATLSYVEGKKDEISYVASGVGLPLLKEQFLPDKIMYAVVAQQVKESTNLTTKFLLITMVGRSCPPLTKARSGAHRIELAEFVKGFMPFHSHFQAAVVDDLEEVNFLEKLRVAM